MPFYQTPYPFRQALEANDLYSPVAPINFYYCGGDEHVTYLNAIIAENNE